MPRRRPAFTATAGQPRATINAAWLGLLPGPGAGGGDDGTAVALASVVNPLQICHRTIAYRPGNLTEVLTGHYRRAHPGAPGIPSR